MKHTTIITAILLSCALSFADGSSSPGNPGPIDPPTDPSPTIEVLKGFTSNHKGITVQVESNGCTSKSNFEISILESYPVQIRVERTKPDWCRGYLQYGTVLKYSYAELGLRSGSMFFLVNEIDPSI
jgi:hypothetical protein